MNNLIHFKLKMLIVLTFCIFMTFSMLVYVMKLTEKCENPENEMCFQVSKIPLVKSNYFLYNANYNFSQMTSLFLKPSFITPGTSTTENSFSLKTKRTTREILKVFNVSLSVYNYSLKNFTKSSKQVPLPYSVSPYEQKVSSAVRNQSTVRNSPVTSSAKSVASSSTQPFKESKFFEVYSQKFRGEVNSGVKKYAERQKNLQQLCRKNFNVSQILKVKKLRLNHILIDEKHKLLYCYVPKVACTNWKRIFLLLTGKAENVSQAINFPSSKVHAKNLFKSLQNYSLSEVQKITEQYTKFIFVRHPFERLLSAYRNKLEQHYDSSKYFQARFGKYIIRNFRKNPSNVSLEKGDDVTFAEFASYLVSSDPYAYNEHWQRIADLCHPCLISYDFIGKYENLIEDSNFLLKYLGWDLSFPVLPKPSTTASNLKKYFNTLDKATIFKLYSIYEMDFKLFGYDLFNTSDPVNS